MGKEERQREGQIQGIALQHPPPEQVREETLAVVNIYLPYEGVVHSYCLVKYSVISHRRRKALDPSPLLSWPLPLSLSLSLYSLFSPSALTLIFLSPPFLPSLSILFIPLCFSWFPFSFLPSYSLFSLFPLSCLCLPFLFLALFPPFSVSYHPLLFLSVYHFTLSLPSSFSYS